MNAEDFCRLLSENGFSSEYSADPVSGIDKAFDLLNEYDALVVCGSLYLAADVRDHIINKIKGIN